MWRASDGPEGKAAVPRFPRAAAPDRASRRRAQRSSRRGRRAGHPRAHKAAPRRTSLGRQSRPQTHTTLARESTPQTHTTRARQSRPRGHTTRAPKHPQTDITQETKPPPRLTPVGHNKAAQPQWGRAAVAVALGFEPRVAVTPHSISSAAPSAARTRYLTRILYYRNPRATQIDPPWEQRHTQREPRSRRSS